MPNILEGQLIAEGKKFALVVSRFNDFISDRLLGGAVDALARHGAKDEDIDIVKVPGAFEIPLVAKKMADGGKYDAVICVGAVFHQNTESLGDDKWESHGAGSTPSQGPAKDDRIKPGLAVSINGEITNDGLRTRIAENDEVHFVAAISGGSDTF